MRKEISKEDYDKLYPGMTDMFKQPFPAVADPYGRTICDDNRSDGNKPLDNITSYDKI